MRRIVLSIAILNAFLVSILAAGPKQSIKRYDSPDKLFMAVVVTLTSDTLGPESSVELRKADGTFIGRMSYFTKVHGEGWGVVKAHWSLDGQFFVYSMISSGGQAAGKFPTYFYSRIDKKMHLLDPAVGMWITDPDFYQQAGDLITVTVHDSLPNGIVADTISRSVHLSNLRR